jgi:alpha-D-ribose 1-methylphosphonate 5-phosphate C-P lyase
MRSLDRGISQEPCAYCGARPTYLVVWEDDQGHRLFAYLCEQCDDAEILALEVDS